MTLALLPRWQARRFSVSPGIPFFDPVLVHERGLLVAGGPDALAVFAVGDRQFEWFAIAKKSWITGFTVSASSLYVQDGPVLINYDLTLGKPFSAINLVTGVRWNIDDSPAPPDSIYLLTGNNEALQRELIAARQAHASALLSAQDQVPVRAAALGTAQLNARGIDFSAPVVRRLQVEGRRSGQVFSLCMDGRVIAIDTALEEPLPLACDDPPLRPELVIAEVPRSGGEVDCSLYYVTASGGINAISASGDLAVLPGWRGPAAPIAARVAPLRFLDGMLLGGGILGAAFFARTLNPAKPPLLEMDGPAGGWRHIDISVREKLLLVSDGLKSRLISYDPAARSRKRWAPDKVSERDAHVLFWPGTGADALEPSPKLTLEIEKVPPSNEHHTHVRVLLANTVDSTDPPLTTNFPPAAILLDQGKLERGPNTTWLPVVDWLPCQPVVTQQNLYTVVCAKPATGAWTYAVVAFSLAPHLPNLLAKAETELAKLRQLARALDVKVTRIDRWYEYVSGGRRILREKGPYAVVNTRLTFELTPGGRVETGTNAEGVARFDSAHAGAKITVVNGPGPCTSSSLTPADVKTIEISTMRN